MLSTKVSPQKIYVSISNAPVHSPALLSRFDIIFILIDKPDEEHDLFLSEHIMNRHSGNKSGGVATELTQYFRVDFSKRTQSYKE